MRHVSLGAQLLFILVKNIFFLFYTKRPKKETWVALSLKVFLQFAKFKKKSLQIKLLNVSVVLFMIYF